MFLPLLVMILLLLVLLDRVLLCCSGPGPSSHPISGLFGPGPHSPVTWDGHPGSGSLGHPILFFKCLVILVQAILAMIFFVLILLILIVLVLFVPQV